MLHKAARFFLLLVSFATPLFGMDEPKYLPTLATGGSPGCPDHLGTRHHRSEIVRTGNTTAWIDGTAVSSVHGCHATASLEVKRPGGVTSFSLPDPQVQHFEIVDFSLDASKILLSALDNWQYPNEDFRSVQIAVLDLGKGTPEWRNAWDVFGWQHCDATVEPQGFTQDGSVAIRVRPSTFQPPRRPNCVKDVGLYAVNLSTGKVSRMPDATEIARIGAVLHAPFQSCKADPDIVDRCFTVHGRLSFYNGTPSIRIWRIGTKRILGVHNELLPEALFFKMDWETHAYGDFNVCPFTKDQAGWMRMVCIEKADHVVLKKPQP